MSEKHLKISLTRVAVVALLISALMSNTPKAQAPPVEDQAHPGSTPESHDPREAGEFELTVR